MYTVNIAHSVRIRYIAFFQYQSLVHVRTVHSTCCLFSTCTLHNIVRSVQYTYVWSVHIHYIILFVRYNIRTVCSVYEHYILLFVKYHTRTVWSVAYMYTVRMAHSVCIHCIAYLQYLSLHMFVQYMLTVRIAR